MGNSIAKMYSDFEIVKSEVLQDTGTVIKTSNKIMCSPQYHERLMNNFDEAIKENVKIVDMDKVAKNSITSKTEQYINTANEAFYKIKFIKSKTGKP